MAARKTAVLTKPAPLPSPGTIKAGHAHDRLQGLEAAASLLKAWGTGLMAIGGKLPPVAFHSSLAEAIRIVAPAYEETLSVQEECRQSLCREISERIAESMGRMNDALEEAGLDRPGFDLEKWGQLARVVDKDPDPMKLSEIADWALVWAAREKLKARYNEKAIQAALAPVLDQIANLRTATCQTSGEQGQAALQYVDLNQIAAVVNHSKSTLEKLKRRKINPLPDPEIPGGGGKRAEWVWSTIKPWLEAEFGRKFSDTMPRRL